MRLLQNNLIHFPSWALILAVGLEIVCLWSPGRLPCLLPFLCPTHDHDLLMLITAVILRLGALPLVAWLTHTHTNTHNWCNTQTFLRLKLWMAMVSSLNCQALNVSARQKESQPELCFRDHGDRKENCQDRKWGETHTFEHGARAHTHTRTHTHKLCGKNSKACQNSLTCCTFSL